MPDNGAVSDSPYIATRHDSMRRYDARWDPTRRREADAARFDPLDSEGVGTEVVMGIGMFLIFFALLISWAFALSSDDKDARTSGSFAAWAAVSAFFVVTHPPLLFAVHYLLYRSWRTCAIDKTLPAAGGGMILALVVLVFATHPEAFRGPPKRRTVADADAAPLDKK